MSDDYSSSDKGGVPAQDRAVEASRPGRDDSNVVEGSRGMYLDPDQVPMAVMQPTTDAGEPAAPAAPEMPSAQNQSETE